MTLKGSQVYRAQAEGIKKDGPGFTHGTSSQLHLFFATAPIVEKPGITL